MDKEEKSRFIRRIIYTVCISWAIVSGVMGFQSNPIAQLISMLLVPAMLIMLGFALAYFRFWKLHRFRAFIPLVVWSFTLVGPILLAHYARDLYFETMISNLEKEIDVYRKTGIYTETEVFGYGGVSTFVNDRRDTIITYWWGGGFPVKHTALLYFNSPESTFVQGGPLALKEAGWRHGYLIQDNWYVASN